MNTFALLAVIMEVLTVWQGRVTVYIRHVREHPHGSIARMAELAEQLHSASALAGVDVEDLTALVLDESGLNHGAVSVAGAVGASQLLPRSRWGRGYLEDVAMFEAVGIDAREQLNILWGAYALRDGLAACGGSLVHAYGFYRTGKCVAGPRAQQTARRAEWIRERTGGAKDLWNELR